VIAKRRDSLYEPGRRSGAWVKMRINKGQELVIGGYVPSGKNFDSLIVGYYEGDDLIYIARVRLRTTPSRSTETVGGAPGRTSRATQPRQISAPATRAASSTTSCIAEW
jgi:hypothetical protein